MWDDDAMGSACYDVENIIQKPTEVDSFWELAAWFWEARLRNSAGLYPKVQPWCVISKENEKEGETGLITESKFRI